jgi:hypothetical protein
MFSWNKTKERKKSTREKKRGITLEEEKEESAAWVAWEGMNPPPEKAALPSNWLPYIASLSVGGKGQDQFNLSFFLLY